MLPEELPKIVSLLVSDLQMPDCSLKQLPVCQQMPQFALEPDIIDPKESCMALSFIWFLLFMQFKTAGAPEQWPAQSARTCPAQPGRL